jgi:predicted membrane protein
MFKFLTKQFIYGRIYLWVKDKLGAILFLFISIFLIIYFHNEYLNYIEYKEKFAESYVGLSFVIKNILILLVAGGYFYFYFVLRSSKKNIEEKSIQKQTDEKEEIKSSNMVSSLDEFLDDDELNR